MNQCNQTSGMIVKPDTHYEVRDGAHGQEAYIAGACPYRSTPQPIWFGWLRHGNSGDPVPHRWTNTGRAICGNRGHDLIRVISSTEVAEELNIGEGWRLLVEESTQRGDQILNPHGWWQVIPAGLVGKMKPKNVIIRRRV